MYDAAPRYDNYKHSLFHTCDHPLYNSCCLYLLPDGRGLAVVEKRWNSRLKASYWAAVRADIADAIYEQPGFQQYLEKVAKQPTKSGLYFTVPVRRVMWALRMPPIPKEDWEKDFAD